MAKIKQATPLDEISVLIDRIFAICDEYQIKARLDTNFSYKNKTLSYVGRR